MSQDLKDFAAERGAEAEQVLLFLRGTATGKPFDGTFCLPGMPVVLAGATPKMVGSAYADAIVRACLSFGANKAVVIGGVDGVVPDILQVVAPITADIEAQSHPDEVIEACAEVVRGLLCGALIAAADDLPAGDAVAVAFRTPPRFELFPDFESNTVYVAARLRAAVYRQSDPARSYLLGGGGKLDYKLPDARMYVGPNRLRFLDMRSPGHIVNEQLLRVSA